MKEEIKNNNDKTKPAAPSTPFRVVKEVGATENTKPKFSIKPGQLVHAKVEGSNIGAAGKQLGTVDHMDGEKFIKLNKMGSPDNQHRWIPIEWVEKADGTAVYLNKTESEFSAKVYHSNPMTPEKKAI